MISFFLFSCLFCKIKLINIKTKTIKIEKQEYVFSLISTYNIYLQTIHLNIAMTSKHFKNFPECIYGNPCLMVCVNPQCRKPGFICENGLKNK